MQTIMKIGVDVMGGDFAPKAIIDGILMVLPELPANAIIVLIGKQAIIEPMLSGVADLTHVEIVNADEVIEMGEHPTKALSQKPNSSIAVGFKLLKNQEIDVFCSAGNTGAMHVGALFSIKAIDGVIRPAIAGFTPHKKGGQSVVLDIGANADCKPEMLEQFGELGSLYAQHTLGIENPKVALMNIGEEPQKGSLVVQAAYQLLKANNKINFVGNIEGKDFLEGKADVIVCDGFTGNILLKFGESIYTLSQEKGIKDELIDRMNYEIVGGSPIVGINGNVIIAHGASQPRAIKNMILLAHRQVESGVHQKIKQALN
jgi:phosphate acyltransferase